MKILAIRGKNLASLAERFEVDFTAGPLADTGLFVISGPTGAGKSTLLDALCLALYDRMPRHTSQRGGAKVGMDPADDLRLTSSDVRGILRRGAGEGFAEVDFVGRDGKRWRSRWEVRRAGSSPTGRFQSQSLTLTCLDEGSRTGATKTETLSAIAERVGLTFDQFCRSVLLAQGDFAAFLHADAGARAELLEKVTGTEIYSKLSRAAFLRRKEAEEALGRLEQQRTDLGVLSDDDRAALEARREAAQVAVDAARVAHARAEAAVAWFQRHAALTESLTQATQQHRGAIADVDAARPRRELLLRARRAQPLHTPLDRLDTQTRAWAAASTEHQAATQQLHARADALREVAHTRAAAQAVADGAKAREAALRPVLAEARALDDTIAALAAEVADATRRRDAADQVASALAATSRARHDALADLRGRRHAAEDWLANNADAGTLAHNWAAIAQATRAARAALLRRDTAEATRREAADALPALDAAVAKAAAQRTQTMDAAARARAVLVLAEAAVQEGARAALEARRNDARARQQLAQAASSAHDQLTDAEQARITADQAAHAELQRGRGLAEEATALGRQEPVVRAQLAEAERARDLAQAALDLEARRRRLVPGDPCPLCGGTDHPWAHGAPELRDDLAARVQDLRDDLDRLVRLKTKAETDHATAQRDAARAAEAAREAAGRRDRHLPAWQEGVAAFPGALPIDPWAPETAEAVATVRAATGHALAAIDAEAQALDAAEHQIRTARRQLDEARHQAEVAEKTHAEWVRQHDALGRTVEAQTGVVREAIDALDEAWRDLEGLVPSVGDRAAWEADTRAPEARWRARADEHRAQQAAHAAADAALRDLEPQVVEARERAAAAARDLHGLVDHVASRTRDLVDLRSKRGALLEGQPVETVEQQLLHTRTEAEARLADAHAGESDANAQRAAAEARRTAAAIHLHAVGTQRDDARAHLDARLAEIGVTEDDARALLARDGEALDAEGDALDALDDAVLRAEALVGERCALLDTHESARPEESDPETVASHHRAVTDRLAEAETTLRTAEIEVARDDANRQKADDLSASIATQARATETWRKLAVVIGSSDGKRFRTFAQGLTLDALLIQANHHLGQLAPRYLLHRVPDGDLDIQVIDRDVGDEPRAIASLSGGETFLGSLALALGLATLSSSSTPVESLFIDEGFGTLDRDTLDVALSALEALREQGRKVGVISHVEGLPERVGVQIRVTKLGGGKSRVRTIGVGDA